MVPPSGRSCIRGHTPSTGAAAAAAAAGFDPDAAGLGAAVPCPGVAGVAGVAAAAWYVAAKSRAGAGAARLNATIAATVRYTGISSLIVLFLRRLSGERKQQGVCRPG